MLIVEKVEVQNAIIRIHDDSYRQRTSEEIQSCIEGYCRCVAESLIQKEKRQEECVSD